MKSFKRLLAIALVSAMVLCAIPFSVSAANLSSMKVVCFGDSLTHYGDGWTTNYDEFQNKIANGKTYPDYLSEKIGTSVYNAGKGGDTTDMALRRLHPEVLAQNPDIVVICLGANDQALNFVTNTNSTSLEAYRKNLEYYVKTITAAGADVVFLTPSPACHDAGCTTGSAYNSGQLVKYCDVMREVAIKYGLSYVDANYDYGFLSNLTQYYIMGDGLHQSAKGREYFASLVANHLKALYENNNKATMTIVCKDQNNKEIKRYTISGAAGARLIVPSPDVDGYTAVTNDIKTTFVNGATHTFTYKLDVAEIAKNSSLAADKINTDMADKMFNMYVDGKANANSSNPNFALLEEYANQMQLISDSKTSGEFIVSLGASYTTTAPNYKLNDTDPYNTGNRVNPIYADDGKKLTDGLKSYKRGEDSRYSVWTSNADIIVDLGEAKNADVFRIYSAGDEWGVALQKNLSIAYKLNESDAWTNVSATAVASTIDADTGDNFWSRNTVTVTTSAPVNARYVKFSIARSGICIWIDEIEVALKNKASANEAGTIDSINSAITGDDTRLFLGGYNFSNNNGNLRYAAYVIAKYNTEKDGFVITEGGENSGTSKDFTLDADSILIAAHNDNGTNWNDFKLIKEAKIGQFILLKRVDTQNGVAVAPAFSVSDSTVEESNIAKGLSYTISGSGKGYYNPNTANPSWGISDYSANLTDGIASETGSFDNAWFGFYWGSEVEANTDINTGIGSVTFDLKNNYDLTKFRVHCYNNEATGIKAPKSINVYVSDDNNAYTVAGALSIDSTDGKVYWSETKNEVTGRYVKFEFVLDSVFCFINEIQIYGAEHKQEEPEVTPPDEDDSSDVVDDSSDVVEDSSDVVEDSSDVVEDSSDVVEDSSDVVEDSSDVIEDSSDVIEDSSDVIEDSSDVVEDSSDVIEDSSDVVDDSSDVVEDSSDVIEDSSDVVDDSSDVVEDSSDDTSSEDTSSEDTSSDDTSSDDESSDVIEEENEIGDINGNDKIDMTDYILLKRAYFGTYNFNETQNKAGDINANGKIDMTDYILLKRIYFGTYSLKNK